MGAIKRTLSFTQVVALSDVIRAHCTRNAEGYAVYEEGWSDSRVYETMKDPGIGLVSIANLRKSLVGEIGRKTDMNSVQSQLKMINAEIARITAWAARRTRDPYKGQ